MHYNDHWDDKFKSRQWGKYPPEDLIRFTFKNFLNRNIRDISVLEVGCGTGANLWFLHREGLEVSGIDSSKTAVQIAQDRIFQENLNINEKRPKLIVGNFESLPWDDNSFDLVIDIFSIYSNKIESIKKTINEVERVMKPGSFFYSKLWGKKTSGYGKGKKIEKDTYQDITEGPCKDMGLAHFFSKKDIEDTFSIFNIISIDEILTKKSNGTIIQEYLCSFKKA